MGGGQRQGAHLLNASPIGNVSEDVTVETINYAEWAELLRVLAHPTRLAILDSLKDGTKCVSDVCEILSVPQPNLSQHLSILRREGVVSFTEDGKKRCYFLTNPALIKALMCVLTGDYAGNNCQSG
ncbi:MAG: ArsR family transcriptional regulator [Zetaproteobacteria bacterium CG_4_9_14_3_um_filter_49_83]|nr:MAG: transcriptional regulator [Zetaproteobacteria bacterium CG17_big_fil_post_rev_8_21_14_2_50_50_13]PIV30046.1 MAG: ArsR family transcriptional regulator [Zetaproteobacteria bacterium CG02_land_8_20_14_3_00_50_9]PIY56459.1 MAG: ArsR family transcriptional regulator [Zetaproteobacteria bacterium CG_4_10_14_0_8_um_filter_49_80]PJA34843.1 MAG: ArsR family transcriptional regulator [Zetaproteobacteria bacterium CG_4_9_14_3_um_filter_49_83]HCX89808.1 ArsR family transcriptional regulator [Delta